jgi:hypothetical protein
MAVEFVVAVDVVEARANDFFRESDLTPELPVASALHDDLLVRTCVGWRGRGRAA